MAKTPESRIASASLRQRPNRPLLPITRITLLLALGYLLTLLAGTPFQATAQTVAKDWETPINLSQSGAATSPRIFADRHGQLHLLWLDSLEGVTYMQANVEGWTVPKPVTSPFTNSVPLLVAGDKGAWHAFWRDEDNILFHSYNEAGAITKAEAWTDPVELTISALTFDAAIGQDGRLHLVYVKSLIAEEGEEEEPIEEEPAGVYYRASDDNGATWSEPVSLYNSLYFRLLEASEARVQIGIAGTSVYTIWDDKPGERVLSRRSLNGGQTWEEFKQVDGREALDTVDSTRPSQIKMITNGERIFLHWQAGHDGITCTQYFQWSNDGGDTWSPRQSIFQDFHICSENNLLFFHKDILLLLTETYLLAWDGRQWSEPETETDLSNFLNPLTFRPLTFYCRQGAASNNRLYLLGCDTPGGGDIWITSRSVANTSDLFSPPSIWHAPQPLTSGEASILAPVSLADAQDQIHLLWSQAAPPVSAGAPALAEASLYYARWDGTTWLGPFTIVTSPTGTAQYPGLALDAYGHLLLVWSGGTDGSIYFSRANADQAHAASTWAAPMLLPAPQGTINALDILVDAADNIIVVYAISLNENRGIYLIKSTDNGQTWSDPVTVFDGASAGWAMVDRPRLSQTGNGHLHLLWTHYDLPPTMAPLALHYARSDDGGDSWSEPQLVAEGPVIWSGIRGLGQRVVHRAWQLRTTEGATLWHQHSLDNGLTWTSPSLIIPGFDQLVGPATIMKDPFEQLHLLQLTHKTLQHWIWEDDGWVAQEDLELEDLSLSTAEALTAAAAADGTLAAIYMGLAPDKATDQLQDTLFFASRPMTIPDSLPTPLPTLMPTPLSTATATPTSDPSPTPTFVFAREVRQETGLLPPFIASSPWAGLILGLIPAGLLVLIVFLIGIHLVRVGRS